MTKEEFKKKYHDKVIEIPYLLSMRSERELTAQINQVANCCAEMELKTTLLPETASFGMPKKLMVVTDPTLSPTGSTEQNVIGFEELLEDFKRYVEEEQRAEAVKVLDILSGMKIKNVDIKHVGASRNMKQLAEDGFIQGYTSNEASLWWNTKGRRLLFVRGEGVFELTDKVEENA